MASLQEQLLKAGMVDARKAKQIEKEKRKSAKQVPKGKAVVNEAREEAKKALAEKTERDRQINHQQRAAAELKAVAAQIRQLIGLNRIERGRGEISYQFTDGIRIKKIHVTSALQNQLSRGQVAVVRSGDGYELVPAAVAEKISQRDDQAVLVLNQPDSDAPQEDDPYADYQIPDDLMW